VATLDRHSTSVTPLLIECKWKEEERNVNQKIEKDNKQTNKTKQKKNKTKTKTKKRKEKKRKEKEKTNKILLFSFFVNTFSATSKPALPPTKIIKSKGEVFKGLTRRIST
jgi:hypothetical protein